MNIFSHLRSLYQARYRSSGVRTLMDIWWYTLIRLSFVLIFAGLLAGGWFFYDAWRGVSPIAASDASVETLSRDTLSQAVADIAQQKVQYDAARKTRQSIVDPGR